MSAEAPYRRSRLRPRTDVSPTAELTLRFDAVMDSVPDARHRVGAWLAAVEVPVRLRDELALVVTELVTNAVEASPGPNAAIDVRARIDDDDLVIVVADHGGGFSLTHAPELPGGNAIRGRGIPIVDALMDSLEVRRVEGRTEVTTVRSLR